MIFLKTEEEIELMRAADQIVAITLGEMGKMIAPGVTTAQLNKRADEVIRDHGAVPNFLNYGGFPASICASINDVVVHGIPSDDQVLKDGDIISIDIPNNRLELKISDEEFAERMANFVPKKKELSGYLKRYAALVSSGAKGAILNV